MNILLTNEAGCFTPGVITLAKALSMKHRVVIVAPLNPSNNAGHSLTMGGAPLRVKQYFLLNKVKIFSVNGTPVDCVTLALDKILRVKPDLVISGISDRPCRGEKIYSSGVVSAAIEGTIHGIPSIALSTKVRDTSNEKVFENIATAFARHLPYYMKHIPASTTLNINYPEKINASKIVCTHLTTGMIDDLYAHEVNPFGYTFYWLKPSLLGHSLACLDQRGDLYWGKKDFITVVPLKLDLTAMSAIPQIEQGGIAL